MKIKVRKIVEEERKDIDPITKRPYKYTIAYENGFVEELDVDFRDITALSFDKSLRLIGIDKVGLLPLTLKSWKELKKEISNAGLMSRFDLSKSI